jgi:uncharacterized protein YjbJ (UPF0337 family)
MVSEQILEGNWNEIKGKLRQRWGQLTDNDFAEAKGHIEQLAGVIQRKTGEGREAIEGYLRELSNDPSMTHRMDSGGVQQARQYVSKAVENVERAGKQAAEQLRAGYAETQGIVREQPVFSMAVCFGAGVVCGLLLGQMLDRR